MRALLLTLFLVSVCALGSVFLLGVFGILGPEWQTELSTLFTVEAWLSPAVVVGAIKTFIFAFLALCVYLGAGMLVVQHQFFPDTVIGTLVTFKEDKDGNLGVRSDTILGPMPLNELFPNRFIRWMIVYKFFMTRRTKQNPLGLMYFGRYARPVQRAVWEEMSSESKAAAFMRNMGMPTVTRFFRFFFMTTLEEGEMSSRVKIMFVRQDDYENFEKRYKKRAPTRGRTYFRIIREAVKLLGRAWTSACDCGRYQTSEISEGAPIYLVGPFAFYYLFIFG